MIEMAFVSSTAHQTKFFERIMEGLKPYKVTGKAAGIESAVRKNISSDNLVACWGWKKGKLLREKGYEVLVFERGYLGDRFHWTSVAWNGLNGRANFCLEQANLTSRRFNLYFELAPWKTEGKHIVIMGQVAGDASLQGKDLTIFYERTAQALKAHYAMPIYFRPHPMSSNRPNAFKPRGVEYHKGTLEEALKDAHLVVTYNSNAAVDAVINGIPALSFDHGSMAYEVTGHRIEERVTPARRQWAANLAWCQWSPDELYSGVFWERMKHGASLRALTPAPKRLLRNA